MKAKVQIKHNLEFEIEEKDTMETMHVAIVLSQPRRVCNECGNNDSNKMYLASNKDTEGNIYINNVCLPCGAKSKLGRYKTGGFFWREFEKYVPKDNGNKSGVDSDGVPFPEE